MLGISVSQTSIIQCLTIIVYCSSSEDNLILAVIIHIANSNAVSALSVNRVRTWRLTLMEPTSL